MVAGAAGALAVALAIWPLGALVRPDGEGGSTPAAGPSYPRPFVCGENLLLGPDASDARAGLTMSVTNASKIDHATGPDLAVKFTADQPMHVRISPTELFQVLYLRDGLIVGGGPMLNEAGDPSAQGLSLPGSAFDVDPEHPWSDGLGPRNRLCAPLTWPEVWSQHEAYEVVLVQGNVLARQEPPGVLLDIPTLGHWPLLVARAPLA